MALFRIRPTEADVAIAIEIASHTGPRLEHAAEALTWGADEHVLCALAACWWLYSLGKDPKSRRVSDHVLLTTLVASALPHLLKSIFDQERPDRLTIAGHLHGVPISGKRLDAFPSGHAVHIGALGSAASVLPTKQRNAIWAVGAGLVLTRILLLAHWTSDVAAGLALGALIERFIRVFTGFGRKPR
jgi:membrane-associated phospholipid phosphatase